MNEFDIPIFKKIYELYKDFYLCLQNFPRQHRYSLGSKCDELITEILASIVAASQLPKFGKLPHLEAASVKVNLLRINFRLAQEIKAMDTKRYLAFQATLDEVGKMLGGWIKMAKTNN